MEPEDILNSCRFTSYSLKVDNIKEPDDTWTVVGRMSMAVSIDGETWGMADFEAKMTDDTQQVAVSKVMKLISDYGSTEEFITMLTKDLNYGELPG